MTSAELSTPADRHASTPEAAGWWAVGVFAVAAVLSYTDRQILNLLVDPLRAELKISDTGVSLLQGAAFAVLYSFAGLPLGRLADMVSRRWLIIAGVATWSAATIACGFAHSYTELFAARICVGIGEAALAPSVISMIGDYFPPARRGTALGVFLTGMVAGVGTAIVIGGYLLSLANRNAFDAWPVIGALSPWRQVLVLVGAPGLIVAVILLTVKEPERAKDASGATVIFPLRRVLKEFGERFAVLGPLYLGLGLLTIGDYAIMAWAPSFLSRKFAMQPDAIGTWLGSIAIITGVIGTLTSGVLADRLIRLWGERARLRIAVFFAFFGLAGASLGFGGSVTQVLALATVWMLITTFAGVACIAAVQDFVPAQMRGIAVSIIAFCNTILGLGLGPTLVALVNDNFYIDPASIGLAITTVAIPTTSVAIVLLWLSERALGRRAQVAPVSA